MVDANYRFIWGSCGLPGNSRDAVIFQATDIWDKIQNKESILDIGKLFKGVLICPLIVADSAFPLQPWLLKPYTEGVLSEKMKYYNYRLIEEPEWCQKGRVQKKREHTWKSYHYNTDLHGFI